MKELNERPVNNIEARIAIKLAQSSSHSVLMIQMSYIYKISTLTRDHLVGDIMNGSRSQAQGHCCSRQILQR